MGVGGKHNTIAKKDGGQDRFSKPERLFQGENGTYLILQMAFMGPDFCCFTRRIARVLF